MAAQTAFSAEMFPVGVSVMEDAHSLSDIPRNTLPAPQLVMLANVAAVTAAEGGGCDGSVADEKEMMELKTVGCSYSDSEDESNDVGEEGDKAEDLSRRSQPCPSTSTKMPQQVTKHKDSPTAALEGMKKKKPFHCKPCHFQAQNEQEFVEHLSTHSMNKMMVVNRVEGRSKTKTKETESPESQAPSGEEVESSGEVVTTGDVKGLIRCERCGYNTNRYDHYIAHLKHHSKEGEDHRVFKCTLCPYTTVSQYHWRKHLRNHFPSKLHTCSQCSYFSDRKSNYIQHIRTHTGVRPFQCPYCDYSSSQKTHLTRHIRTHSGVRPFQCPYCDYSSSQKTHLTRHMRTHSGQSSTVKSVTETAAFSLQYHIKSRHSGYNVALDVSKVKLRVKKPGPEGAEENSDSRASKFDNSSSVEEDLYDGDEDEGGDSSPINLSVRKSSRPSIAQPMQSETQDKAQKKSNAISEKEKPQKVKEKVEPGKKGTTKQKKMEKVNENPVESTSVKESPTEMIPPPVNTDNKGKRQIKKLQAEKTTVQDQAEVPESHKGQMEKSEQQRSVEERVVRKNVERVEEKSRPEKEKEQQKNDGSGKENKSLNKPRKSGSKKPEKITVHVQEAQQKPDSHEMSSKQKVVKEKALKRKAVEALDLSKKFLSEIPPKGKRLKTTAAEKLQLKPASEDINRTNGSTMRPRSNDTTPVRQTKTRSSSKKQTTSLQQTVDPAKDKTNSVNSPCTEAPEASAQMANLTQSTDPEHHPREHSNTPADEIAPPLPERTLNNPSERMDISAICSSGQDTASPAEDHPAPTFLKPTSPPSLALPGQRIKPVDPEDDEGIHSSHEGGSDISDSASESSDDSGLNGNGAGLGKMASDPETPTDEIPTPTELKSHMCIFCDRTFPLEVDYRRHLNRHLVNVYYMDNTARGPK
uniref:C2H2-type domain-containing protein n=1 Tax=Monopterus albus TaxID=43700 RepID=A0A3Q3KH08_MONAL